MKYQHIYNWVLKHSDGKIKSDDLLNKNVIYAWINKENGMIYIGKTINFYARMDCYKSKNAKEQPKLYNAIKKYGWDNFKLEIIEANISEDVLLNREKYWIKYLNTFDISNKNAGYNLTAGGDGFVSGETHPNKTPEAKEKLSKSKLGSLNPMFGKEFSKDHKKALSEAGKGRKMPESSIRKGAKNNNFGKPPIPVVQKAFREANEKRKKPFKRRETGEIFNSLNEACNKYEINKSNLSKHLKRTMDRIGIKGMQFDYIIS